MQFSLEQQLFNWTECDVIDHTVIQFYDCTLKQAMGEYKIGDVLPTIVFSLENSKIIFLKNGNIIDEFDLIINTRR